MKRFLVIVGAALALVVIAFVAGRITGKSAGTQVTTHRVLYYVDPMHPSYRSDKPGIAPDCGMALEPVYEGDSGVAKEALPAGSVTLTPEKQQLIGVKVETVAKSSGAHTVRTTGRVTADENHVYRIMAGADGWIQTLENNPPGTAVKKSQELASLYSPDFRTAETSYLGFLSGVERLKAGMDASDQKKIDDSLHVNEEQLRLLGMGEDQLEELSKTRRPTSSIKLVAPGDGIVLSRSVSPQQRFDKGTELFRIADLRKVWIVADIHGDDGEIRPGSRVKVKVPELARTIDANVSANTPLFDAASRTLKLRLEADNPGLLLRPDMFVEVEFEASAPKGLSVPSEAVLDGGMHKVVYVETSDGVFERRLVEVAGTYGDRLAIAKGVAEGDRVVVSGNFLLDSESRMRATVLTASSSQPEMKTVAQHEALRDPVCGMTLQHGDANLTERYRGQTYTFCSASCRKKFQQDPSRYAGEHSVALDEHQGEHQHD